METLQLLRSCRAVISPTRLSSLLGETLALVSFVKHLAILKKHQCSKVCFHDDTTRWWWYYTAAEGRLTRASLLPACPHLSTTRHSSILASKMIHLDSTNHLLILNMIVLKFISWAELDVIVNCNEWCSFAPSKCIAHYIMVWKQMYFPYYFSLY